jgi:hypothetical protein
MYEGLEFFTGSLTVALFVILWRLGFETQ